MEPGERVSTFCLLRGCRRGELHLTLSFRHLQPFPARPLAERACEHPAGVPAESVRNLAESVFVHRVPGGDKNRP